MARTRSSSAKTTLAGGLKSKKRRSMLQPSAIVTRLSASAATPPKILPLPAAQKAAPAEATVLRWRARPRPKGGPGERHDDEQARAAGLQVTSIGGDRLQHARIGERFGDGTQRA